MPNVTKKNEIPIGIILLNRLFTHVLALLVFKPYQVLYWDGVCQSKKLIFLSWYA